MKSVPKTLIAVLVAASLTSLSIDSMAVDFSEKELARLQAGKAVKKPLANSGSDGFYGGTGFALIDAPADVVWKAILDWKSYDEVYPKTVDVREVSRRGDRSLVRMELGHKLISLSYFVDVRVDKDKWQIDYKLVTNKPHDIEEAHGYWRLFPQKDGRTLVAYVAAVKVPMGIINLIPSELEKKINRNLLASPRYLRQWVQGPTGLRYFDAVARAD